MPMKVGYKSVNKLKVADDIPQVSVLWLLLEEQVPTMVVKDHVSFEEVHVNQPMTDILLGCL